MSYNLGIKAIRRLCEEQNPSAWCAAKLSKELFKPKEVPVFEWVNEYVLKHNSLPKIETLTGQFPEVADAEVPEPVSYYLGLLENSYYHAQITKANFESNEILKLNKDAWEEAAKVIQKAIGNIAAFKTKGTNPSRYKRLEAADLVNAPAQRWLVKGTLPETGVGAIYGPPGSGKSFLAIDLCVAIAEGEEWFGLRTTPADVTYICLEGAGGLGKRLKAWTIENKRDIPARLKLITEPFDLQKPEDITELCAEQAGKGGVVMIDTLNRASPGADENSGKDMSVLLAGCAQIQRITGGVVLAIHHTGKDAARGLRGHSSLLGALDASIEVTRTGEWREWRDSKVRDEQDGTAYPFRLQRIEMGFNQDGDAITSCVVRPVSGENPSLKPAPKSVQFLRDVYAELSIEGPVTVGALLHAAQEKFVPEKDGKAFVRANYKAALATHLGTGSKELADDKVLYIF